MVDAPAKVSRRTKLRNAEPQLFVADVERACDYYRTKLGFDVAFVYGEPPFYGQVVRGGATLNLKALHEPAIDPDRREKEQLLSASITLERAEPLFREFEKAGVTFHQSLKTEPWGARTFVARDLDGNLILFAGRR